MRAGVPREMKRWPRKKMGLQQSEGNGGGVTRGMGVRRSSEYTSSRRTGGVVYVEVSSGEREAVAEDGYSLELHSSFGYA